MVMMDADVFALKKIQDSMKGAAEEAASAPRRTWPIASVRCEPDRGGNEGLP